MVLTKSILLLSIWFNSNVYVHSWYDIDCCSGKDCRPIACDELIELDDGRFAITYNNYTYKIEKSNIRPSKDNKCHICIPGYGVPRCAYVQQGY